MLSLYPTYCEKMQTPKGGFGTLLLEDGSGLATLLLSTEYKLLGVDMDGVATVEFNYPPRAGQSYRIIPRIVAFEPPYLIGNAYD